MQIERYQHNGYTIVIDTDDNPMSPRDADNATVMLCWHRDYELGDQDGTALNLKEQIDGHDWHTSKPSTAIVRWLRIFHGATVVQPLYLLDHSGLSIRTGKFHEDPGGWDTSPVGWIFDTAERREVCGTTAEDAEQIIDAEVKDYDTYLTGGYVGYAVLNERGEVLDSCYGFSDLKDCKTEAEAAVPTDPDRSLTDAAALDDLARMITVNPNMADKRIANVIARTGRKTA
jgi:hypothetical protein